MPRITSIIFSQVIMLLCFIVFSPTVASSEALLTPRFVSLKKEKVYLRTGTSMNHSVDWEFRRKGLPVEITAEFKDWRRIRDSDGVVGWINVIMLVGKRTVLILEDERIFRNAPNLEADYSFRAAKGVLFNVVSCNGLWCRLSHGKQKAWTLQKGLWGVYSGEILK